MKSVLGFIIIILIIFCDNFGAHASTIVLSGCSQSDVSIAISSAVDGDTIKCPVGSCTWTSAVSINNKNITLQGAGIDQTTISIAVAGGFNVPATNTKAFRVTGFTFRSTANFGTDSGWAMFIIRGGNGWRIDNNKFKIYSDRLSYDGGNGIYTRNAVGGVIDHNQFVNESTSTNCWHAAVYPEGAASTAWTWPSQIGNATYTVFIEDNTFEETRQCSAHNPHAVYGQNGGIFVARHNTIINANIDSHGFCATAGTREYEISNNKWIVSTGRNLARILYLRGGTGVIYNNSLTLEGTGIVTNGIGLTEYRVNAESQCSGSVSRSGIIASSCCNAGDGYPCIDQIGRGQDQSTDPLYIWNNTNFPSIVIQNVSSGCSGDQTSGYIKLNRDYYMGTAKPGYIGYQYPHPLTGDPCIENCGNTHLIPNPPVITGVN